MIRQMVNCPSSAISAVKARFPDPAMVGYYSTGTPDIAWTPAQQAEFPGSTMVGIDQGFSSPPVTRVPVRDVEANAWALSQATDTSQWQTERPTIYCARDTLAPLTNIGWKKDVWLAWPGYTGTHAPQGYPFNIVAVQNVFATDYELSDVYDESWPYLREASSDMLNLQVTSANGAHVPFPAGTFKSVTLYRDFLSKIVPAEVRLAVHSVAHGYFVFNIVLDAPVPRTHTFSWADVDAVSIEIAKGTEQIGATLL